MVVNDNRYVVTGSLHETRDKNRLTCTINGVRSSANVVHNGNSLHIFSSVSGMVTVRSHRAKAKAKSLPICYIVSYLCVYTAMIAALTKIKEKNSFRLHSDIQVGHG